MTLADDLGISEQELQESINLERLYNLITKVKDRCSRCGTTPIAYVNTDKLELLCDACGRNKAHSKRVGAAKLRTSDLDKLEKRFGKQSSHSHHSPPKSLRASEGDSRKRRSVKKKKVVSSSSSSSDGRTESTDEKSTISSDDASSDHKKRKKKGKKKKSKRKPSRDDGIGSALDPWANQQTPQQFGNNPSPLPGIVGMLQQQQQQPNRNYFGSQGNPMSAYGGGGFYDNRPRPPMRNPNQQVFWNRPGGSNMMPTSPQRPWGIQHAAPRWPNPTQGNPFPPMRNPMTATRGNPFQSSTRAGGWPAPQLPNSLNSIPFGGGRAPQSYFASNRPRPAGSFNQPFGGMGAQSGTRGYGQRNPFSRPPNFAMGNGTTNRNPGGGFPPNFTTSGFFGSMEQSAPTNQAAVSGVDLWRTG